MCLSVKEKQKDYAPEDICLNIPKVKNKFMLHSAEVEFPLYVYSQNEKHYLVKGIITYTDLQFAQFHTYHLTSLN